MPFGLQIYNDHEFNVILHLKLFYDENEDSDMLNKKFMGIVAFAVTTFSVTILGTNYLYAEKEETHKHLEKGLAPEHKTAEQFVCPQCKEVRVSPIKGKTLAKWESNALIVRKRQKNGLLYIATSAVGIS